VNHTVRVAIGLVAVAGLGSGCGSNAPAPAPGQPVVAGANSRIQFKEDYKKMIGKDGKMLWKPSESKRRPAGVP
jgi:hypothetical protein